MAAAPEGYSGQLSLGGSSFSLAIDAAGFKQQLDAAESSAMAASARIGKEFGRGGNAAMGLLYLGQAVDDLQYGFRAIVNNIPQITMALGGSAGAAGLIGILAVAANQLINHWDELKASMGDSQAFQDAAAAIEKIGQAIDDVSQALSGRSFAELLAGGPNGGFLNEQSPAEALLKYFGLGSGQRAAGRQAARDKAEGEAAERAVAGVGDAAKAERAKLFRESLEAYGGGEKLQQEYAQRLQNRFPKMNDADAARMAARVIQSAMEGNAFGGGKFGLAFEKVFDKLAMEKDTEKLNRAGEENEKLVPDLHKDWRKELEQQGAENERRMVAQLEMERDAMQKRMRMEQDRAGGMAPAQHFGSAREYFTSMTVRGADQIRRQQLDVAKATKNGIDRINDKLDAIRHARFQ